MDLRNKIAAQVYVALDRLGAEPELLSIVGSYGDTLDDSEVLEILTDYNQTGRALHTQQ